MRKQALAMALVGLVALAVGGGPRGAQAQENPRVVAPRPLTLLLEDLPAGRHLGHTVNFESEAIQAQRFTRMEGAGPEVIVSMALLGYHLASETDSEAFIKEFAKSFESTSGMQMRDLVALDAGNLGEQALMYRFRYQPTPTGAQDADTTLPTAGHGALVAFSRGDVTSVLMVLNTDDPTIPALRDYAAIVDARIAHAVSTANAAS